MAKIENEAEKAPTGDKRHTFEVLVSFDALEKGARFGAVPDGWTRHGVTMGYLRDEGEEGSDVRSEESSR